MIARTVIRALWGQEWARPPLAQARSTAATGPDLAGLISIRPRPLGDSASADGASSRAVPGRGQSCPLPSPSLSPRNWPICRQMAAGTVIRAFWGQQWARLPFLVRMRRELPPALTEAGAGV